MSDEQPNAVIFGKLRAETCGLLGFDLDHLSAWQEARLDTTVMLRWELDRMQSEMMAGKPVDAKQIAAIGEQLEAALHPIDGTNAEASEPDNREAREALASLVLGIAEARAHGGYRVPSRLGRLINDAIDRVVGHDDAAEEAEAAVAVPPPASVASPAPSITAPEQSTSEHRSQSEPPPSNARTTYLDLTPEPEALPPAPPPAESSNPLRYSSVNNPNAVPTPSMPKPPESSDWRSHLTASGEIRAPWFKPFG
jgi:hypothetical protein